MAEAMPRCADRSIHGDRLAALRGRLVMAKAMPRCAKFPLTAAPPPWPKHGARADEWRRLLGHRPRIHYIAKSALDDMQEKVQSDATLNIEHVWSWNICEPEDWPEDELMLPVDMTVLDMAFDSAEDMACKLGCRGTAAALLQARWGCEEDWGRAPEEEKWEPMTAAQWLHVLEMWPDGELDCMSVAPSESEESELDDLPVAPKKSKKAGKKARKRIEKRRELAA